MSTSGAAPRTGRPRSGTVDSAVLTATLDLLAELPGGYPALTIQAVADRAGAGKASIYRRYPAKAHLVIAALAARFGLDPAPDLGSLAADLLAVQRHQIRFFNDPSVAGALPGLLSDLSDDALREHWLDAFLIPRRSSTHRVLERAMVRGEIAEDVDVEWICDCLTGPLLAAAHLRGRRTLPDALADRTARMVLAMLGSAPSDQIAE